MGELMIRTKPSMFQWILFICIGLATSTSLFNAIILNSPMNKTNPDLEKTLTTITNELALRGVTLKRKDIIYRFYTPSRITPKIGVSSVAYFYPSLTGKTIAIDKQNYDKSSEDVREALLLHEIGHSFGVMHDDSWKWFGLGKGATLDFRSKSCAISVMHSSDDMAGCFQSFRSYYYDELVVRIKASETINKLIDTVSRKK